MSEYFLKGIKDPRFKVKDMEPLVLTEEDQKVLESINLLELFDTYDILAKTEYPDKPGIDMPEGIDDSTTVLDYLNLKLDTDQLVLYSGDLYGMSGFTSHGATAEVPDTIFVDPSSKPYDPLYTLAHEMGHTETIEGEPFLHNISETGESVSYPSEEEMFSDWEQINKFIESGLK